MKMRTALLALFFLSQTVLAETKNPSSPNNPKEEKQLKDLQESSFLSTLDYPELQVVPRASERLAMESLIESDSGWAMMWPYQLSAAFTIGTGIMMKGKITGQESGETDEAYDKRRKASDFASTAAIGIGALWMGFSVYVVSSQPYTTELTKIRKIKGNDKKNDLLRERLAEEALQKPADLVKTLTWTSVLSNAFAAIYLFDKGPSSMNIYPLGGLVMSFVPAIFQSRYLTNYEKHLEYKRKIYAPVVNTSLFHSQKDNQFYPQLVMSWNF